MSDPQHFKLSRYQAFPAAGAAIPRCAHNVAAISASVSRLPIPPPATPGPNAVGDQLKYTFKQGGKTSVMDGEILARTPGERLYCRYWDRAFEVLVDLRVAAAGGGSRLTHVIEIVPKTFLCKLFSPLIRLGLPKQTKEAMANLKKMLEAPSA